MTLSELLVQMPWDEFKMWMALHHVEFQERQQAEARERLKARMRGNR